MGRRLDRDEWRLCVAALDGQRDRHGVARVGCPLCERVRGRLDVKRSLYCHDDGGFVCFRCGASGALPGSHAAAERRARAALRGGASGFGAHVTPDRAAAWLAGDGDTLGYARPAYTGPTLPLPPGIAPVAPDDPLASSLAAVSAGAYNPGRPATPGYGATVPRGQPQGPALPPLPAALQARLAARGAALPTLGPAASADPLPPLTPEWEPPAGVTPETLLWPWQLPPPGFRRLYSEDRVTLTAEGLADPLDAALAPYRGYVATRQRRADGTEGLDRAVVELAGLGACLAGPLAGYVVAPVWAPDGVSWWGWVARLVVPRPDAKVPQHTYRFAPRMPWHTYLDGQGALDVETDSPAFVVEGFFDRLHLYPDGVATLSKPTPAQLAILARSRRPVVLLPDGDAWEAAVYQAAALRAEGVRAGVVRLPPRVDPDEVPEAVLRDAGWYALRTPEPVCLGADDTAA